MTSVQGLGKSDAGQIAMFFTRDELFRALGDADREYLAEICRFRRWKKREILFHEGDSADAAYLLVSGQVQLSRPAGDGREVVIATVRPVRLFAEVVLFEDPLYPVTSTALTAVRAIRIPRQGFLRLIDENSGFRHRFIGLLMKRQRYLTERVRYLTLYDLEERFFRYLAAQYGRGPVMYPGISRKDMAAAIGTTPESLSRLLGRLKADGTLRWEGDRIELSGDPFPSQE